MFRTHQPIVIGSAEEADSFPWQGSGVHTHRIMPARHPIILCILFKTICITFSKSISLCKTSYSHFPSITYIYQPIEI